MRAMPACNVILGQAHLHNLPRWWGLPAQKAYSKARSRLNDAPCTMRSIAHPSRFISCCSTTWPCSLHDGRCASLTIRGHLGGQTSKWSVIREVAEATLWRAGAANNCRYDCCDSRICRWRAADTKGGVDLKMLTSLRRLGPERLCLHRSILGHHLWQHIGREGPVRAPLGWHDGWAFGALRQLGV